MGKKKSEWPIAHFLVSTSFENFEVLMVLESFVILENFEVLMVLESFVILENFKVHNFINSGNKWRIILPFTSYLVVSVPP